MTLLNEYSFFARQLLNGATDVGALLPTSKYAARAMVSEAARRRGPRRILEVGCGTGPITSEIVNLLRPGDELVLCDINIPFIDYMKQRFDQEARFSHVKQQVEFQACSATMLDESRSFDFIISALPFTRLGSDLTHQIIEKYRRMLASGGVVSYIEYAYLRSIKDAVVRSKDSSSSVVDSLLSGNEFRRDTIWRNAPPAWVHHLRFDDPDATKAGMITPMEHTQRIRIGAAIIDTDASGFMIGGVVAAWALSKTVKRGTWFLPLIAGGMAAWFLRDPERTSVADEPETAPILSACDGRVLSVEHVSDALLGETTWLRIAVFLAITDVHVNRYPIGGKVIDIIRKSGSHAVASGTEAESNEAQYTILEAENGERVVVAQRVGAIARRIVNRSRIGSLVARGEKFGLIRFGSRTDVYLPAETTKCDVKPGDIVIGGETVIARFK